MKNHFNILGILLLLLFASCAQFESFPNQAVRGPAQVSVINPGAITIDDPSIYSQVVAISDVHGMYDQLVTLLVAGQIIDKNYNWIAGKTLLVVVGDSIDKGSNSVGVVDLWIKLQDQASRNGGKLIHLLGNHEAEFLVNPQNDKASELLAELQTKNISVTDLTSSTSVRGSFIHNEVLAAKIGKWIFSHSGFYPNMTWADFSSRASILLGNQNYSDDFIIGVNSILEAKQWERMPQTLLPQELRTMDMIGVYGNVFGHQPDAFNIKGRSAA